MNRIEFTALLTETLESLNSQTDSELYNILFNSLLKLNNGKLLSETMATLNSQISWYLVTHKYNAPSKIIEIAYITEKEFHKKRGKGSFLNMLAITLSGIK